MGSTSPYGAKKTKPIDDANAYEDLNKRRANLNPQEKEQLTKLEQAGLNPQSAQAALDDPQNQQDHANWKEGGAYRLAAHAAVWGLTGGGLQSAAGAAASQAAVPLLGEALQGMDMPADVKKLLIQAAGMAVGAATGGGTVGAVVGQNATANNYLYHYKGKIIAKDSKDNDKIINVSDVDLLKLAAENPEVLLQLLAGIGKTDAPILVKDSSAMSMTNSTVQDLNNAKDRAAIARESDMGYVNTDGKARVFVQTGMGNKPEDAQASAQALSNAMGGASTGYIVNGTQGLGNDVGEYLPNSLSKKDVLNEYTYRTLNAQGPTLIVTHSAGNEDAKKALQAGALYGHTYENLSFVSVGSPVSGSVMRQNVTQADATYLGQVNDWRDPVTYSKSVLTIAGASGAVGAVGAVGSVGAVGTADAILTGAAATGPWGWLAIGGSVAVTGVLGAAKYGVDNYHPLEKYLAKPSVQSIMHTWKNTQGK